MDDNSSGAGGASERRTDSGAVNEAMAWAAADDDADTVEHEDASEADEDTSGMHSLSLSSACSNSSWHIIAIEGKINSPSPTALTSLAVGREAAEARGRGRAD